MQHKIQDCCILSNHVPLILNVFLLDIFIGCDKKQLTTWSQQHKNMTVLGRNRKTFIITKFI